VEIAIFKVNQLGDNVVFLPVVEELLRIAPDLGITLLTSPVAAPLFERCLARDRIIVMERSAFNGAWRRPWVLAGLLRRLRRIRPEASLLSYDQGSVAHLLARFSGGAVRVGSAHLGIRLPDGLTHRVACGPDMDIVAWNWEMGACFARALGIDGWGTAPKPPDLSHLVGAPAPARGRPLVLIHPGASREYQRWPAAFYSETASLLLSVADVQWIDRPELTPHPLHPGIRRITSPTTGDLVRRIASASLFLGNNSGPMHIASTLGVPTVVLTGPSFRAWDPAWHRERCEVLRRADLPCQPCDRLGWVPNVCLNRTAPLACLLRWTPAQVADRCISLLRREGRLATGEGTGR
jgi:ADP-heptose:LPS heptosyltransferase